MVGVLRVLRTYGLEFVRCFRKRGVGQLGHELAPETVIGQGSPRDLGRRYQHLVEHRLSATAVVRSGTVGRHIVPEEVCITCAGLYGGRRGRHIIIGRGLDENSIGRTAIARERFTFGLCGVVHS